MNPGLPAAIPATIRPQIRRDRDGKRRDESTLNQSAADPFNPDPAPVHHLEARLARARRPTLAAAAAAVKAVVSHGEWENLRYCHSSFSSLKSSLFSSSLHRYPSAAQSFSSAARSTAVEHVVLFKFHDFADQSKIDAVMSGVRSLISLDVVAHLTAGPVLRHRSAAAGFSHLLHGRYRSKDDLVAYSAHPAHVAVVKELGVPILEDILAVDWVADLDGPMVPPPGSAMRLTLAKPKEGAESKLKEMLAKAKASASAPTVGTQVSFGENFSPARAKGYGVGLLAVFPGLEELDAMDAREKNTVDSVEEKVKPLLESSIVLDFVVPPPSTDDI